jgi:hypothetical protein
MLAVAVTVAALALAAAVAPAQAAPPGFVTRNGNQLELDGQSYRFTGINIYNANNATGCWYPMASGSTLDDSLAAISPGGGPKVIRAWFFQALATIDGQRDWSGFDHTLAVAAARGVKVIVTLGNQWIDCDGAEGGAGSYKTKAWYQTGYTQPDPAGTLSYRDYVEETVTRYKNDPTILAWQLINEAEAKDAQDGACSTDAGAALKTFAEDVSGLIKSIDPDHLVSVGTIGSGQCGAGSADEYRELHDVATVDLCEFHDYGSPTAPMPGDIWNGLENRINQCNTIGKPLFVGETGIRDDEVASSQERADRFAAKFALQFAAGVVGQLVWAWNKDGSIGSYDIGPGDPTLAVLDAYRDGSVPASLDGETFSMPGGANPPGTASATCIEYANGVTLVTLSIDPDDSVVAQGPYPGPWTLDAEIALDATRPDGLQQVLSVNGTFTLQSFGTTTSGEIHHVAPAPSMPDGQPGVGAYHASGECTAGTWAGQLRTPYAVWSSQTSPPWMTDQGRASLQITTDGTELLELTFDSLPTDPPVAVDDQVTVASGFSGIALASVLANDTLADGSPATLVEVGVSFQGSTPRPSPYEQYVRIEGDGTVTVAPGTPDGTYTAYYIARLQHAPGATSSAQVTVDVGGPVGPVDGDGDGVPDELDDGGVEPGFSNVVDGRANPTVGTVTAGSATVADVADPAKGVRITAGAGGSTVHVCEVGGSPGFDLDIEADESVTVTCNSVIVEDATGPVTVRTPHGVVVVFDQGDSGEVGDESTVTVATGQVTVTVAGVSQEVGPGAQLVVLSGATLCSVLRSAVEGSAKWAGAGRVQRAAASALVNAACKAITAIGPTTRPAPKRTLVAAYKKSVDALRAAGWLAPDQATTLKTMADAL